jgi:hypothetical protein
MILAGVTLAVLYALYAVVLYVFRGQAAFDAVGATLAQVIASYFAGGILGGVAVGLLWPLSRHREGAIVIGIVTAFIIFSAVRFASVGSFTRWTSDIWASTIIAAVLLGGLVANFFWSAHHPRKRE